MVIRSLCPHLSTGLNPLIAAHATSYHRDQHTPSETPSPCKFLNPNTQKQVIAPSPRCYPENFSKTNQRRSMPADIHKQLELLRASIAGINLRFATPAPRREPVQHDVSRALPGTEVETPLGKHWESETHHPAHRYHGSASVGELASLPPDLFRQISNGEVRDAGPAEWAFLDTETTGLTGGSGTFAFLIGVGRITADGFRIRQFFLREPGEEPSVLASLAAHLEPFRVLVTYNGKAYDQPLLETRYRLVRARPPFARMDHLDLLYTARRLWKLRLESCRLVEIESRILGIERQDDVPGSLIPSLYFDYLHTGRAARLASVFSHNASDILTLACLCGIAPRAFAPGREATAGLHGAEIAGVARWCRQMGDYARALELFRAAIARGLGDDLLFRTLWDAAALEKKLGQTSAAVQTWKELAGFKNPFRTQALEELAKHYEHREADPAAALEFTRAALALDSAPALARRRERLEKKLAKHAGGGLL
jgi:uncharacterized protein YprB with RNaseH-like and TPR domain